MHRESSSEWMTCDCCGRLNIHLVENNFMWNPKTRQLEWTNSRFYCSTQGCYAVTVVFPEKG